MSVTVTSDGKIFDDAKCELVGSVTKARDKSINRPAKIGEYPVFVEQFDNYRTFTYPRKIVEIQE